MTTIEQRAKCYSHRVLSGYEKAERDAYIQGATEQRDIDIEKAIYWLNHHTNWDDIYADNEDVAEKFREEMKKQWNNEND